MENVADCRQIIKIERVLGSRVEMKERERDRSNNAVTSRMLIPPPLLSTLSLYQVSSSIVAVFLSSRNMRIQRYSFPPLCRNFYSVLDYDNPLPFTYACSQNHDAKSI
jgi:hypothetical protein